MSNLYGGGKSSGESVGIVPRSLQIDFDKEEKKIHDYENVNKRFHRDMKLYIEKLDSLLKSESKLLVNVTNYSSIAVDTLDDGAHHSNTETIVRTFQELLGEHLRQVESFKSSCQTHVVEPIKQLNLFFPQIHQAIKKREHSLKELLKQQKQLERLREKEHTGANLTRINELEQTIQMTKTQFRNENKLLMDELPKFYSTRLKYIRPCVNCAINNQLEFYEYNKQFYDSILDTLARLGVASEQEEKRQAVAYENAANASKCEEDRAPCDTDKELLSQLNNTIQTCLSNIKSLSIVAAD